MKRGRKSTTTSCVPTQRQLAGTVSSGPGALAGARRFPGRPPLCLSRREADEATAVAVAYGTSVRNSTPPSGRAR